MMDQTQQRQKGGVVSFIIIGVVLLVLLASGVYLSKQQGRIASRNGTATNTPAPEKAAEPEKKSNDTPAAQPNNKPQPSGNSNNGSNTQNTPQTQPNQPQSQAPRTTTPPAVANTGPSEIASTGTGEVLIAAVALGAVTGGISFYRQSTARMHRAALRS